jgi:hypothetical protein
LREIRVCGKQQIGWFHHITLKQQGCSLDDVSEFSYIPGPWILHHPLEMLPGNADGSSAEFTYKVLCNLRHSSVLAQWGMKMKDCQTIIEI